jgi:hypothetical protein
LLGSPPREQPAVSEEKPTESARRRVGDPDIGDLDDLIVWRPAVCAQPEALDPHKSAVPALDDRRERLEYFFFGVPGADGREPRNGLGVNRVLIWHRLLHGIS